MELRGLHRRLGELGYSLQLTEEAKNFVAKKGYDVQFGARPLKRAIQTYIEDEVCERILGGELQYGDTITVSISDDGNSLNFVAQHTTKADTEA